MKNSGICEYTEYWLNLDLEKGDLEKLEANQDIMDNCEECSDTEFISVTFEGGGDAEELLDLIKSVLA